MFDINNFVIDHVLRGMMFAKDGSYMWSINQITDPSLSVTTETADAVDALGGLIARFNRSKTAEFTANNSLFDLGLYAAQQGSDKIVADTSKKVIAPAFKEITVANDVATWVLSPAPIAEVTAIYKLNDDGTVGQKYEATTTASATECAYDDATHTITLPTGRTAETKFFVQYEYETENATEVVGDAINFPKAGKFIMEILGTDVCDQSTIIHAYLVFPNAKLDANVDVSFTTDGNHPFTLQAQQDYCDAEKKLFYLVVPQEA